MTQDNARRHDDNDNLDFISDDDDLEYSMRC